MNGDEALSAFNEKHPGCCPRCGWHLSSHGHSHGHRSDCPVGISPAHRDGTLAAVRKGSRCVYCDCPMPCDCSNALGQGAGTAHVCQKGS